MGVTFATPVARATETTTYTYDELGRLTKTQSGATGPTPSETTNIDYDNAGNRENVSITNAPDPSIFSIADVSVSESAGTATFTVTKSAVSRRTITVDYATSAGSAVAGTDYMTKTDQLTFAPSDLSESFTVTILNDATAEPDETFNVTLSNNSGGAIGDGVALGTITNDDAAGPSFSISNATITEGGNLSFTVTATGTSVNHSINYATGGGTATAGSDYTAKSNSLTFTSAGSQSVSVTTLDDTAVEQTETVQVTLSLPNGSTATISDGTGVGSIMDNDVGFSVASGPPVAEGSPLTFTVSKTAGPAADISYSTSDGTAIAGSDYNTASNTLNFAAGPGSQTVSVATIDDAGLESPETVNLTLSAPTNGATITTAQASGTINDNDATSFSIAAGPSAPEGTGLTFTVTKTGPAAANVNYTSSDGTATAGSDYTATSNTLTFGAGTSTQTITVPTTDDTATESGETVTMTLSGPTNGATLGTASASNTITDNDTAGTRVWIADMEYVEGYDQTFGIFREGPGATFSVNYATSNGTAIAGTDYTAKSGTVYFFPWETYKTFTIAVAPGDTVVEPDKLFNVTLSNPTNGVTITDGAATGRIMDNDSIPPGNDMWYVTDYFLTEGGSLTVTVYRNDTSSGAATINYSVSPASATAGSDYTPVSGTLSFSAFQNTRTFTINTLQDTTVEGDETFNIVLTPTKTGDIVAGATPDGMVIIKDDE